MRSHLKRATAAILLALAAGGTGYVLGTKGASPPRIPAQEIAAPPPGSIRVIYSLDRQQNDREIIALIKAAKSHIYFAIYEFTLRDIADALVQAKRRGIEVRGLVDAGESANSYVAPIIAELERAGIPLETERHADGNGIMHIKAIVTDSAYALGSYNWTASATTQNDELLEIGTDPALVKTYQTVLLRLLETYKGNTPAGAAAPSAIEDYDYTEAAAHIGKYARVHGVLVQAHVSTSGTVFLDFCRNYKTCPFSAVIFAEDASKFGDLSRYAGRTITLTGTISSYRGRAELELSDPSQIAAAPR